MENTISTIMYALHLVSLYFDLHHLELLPNYVHNLDSVDIPNQRIKSLLTHCPKLFIHTQLFMVNIVSHILYKETDSKSNKSLNTMDAQCTLTHDT